MGRKTHLVLRMKCTAVTPATELSVGDGGNTTPPIGAPM